MTMPTTMTSLQRYRAMLQRQPFDRVALQFGATGECWQQLAEYLGEKDYEKVVFGRFGVDLRGAWPAWTGPEGQKFADGSWLNSWGVHMRRQSYGDGRGTYDEAIAYPLANATSVADVERHAWPKPEWHDFSSVATALRQQPEAPFIIGYAAIGWWSWEMRGMEQFLQDLLVEPEVAAAIVDHVADYAYDYFRALIDANREHIARNFVAIQLADDWATQNGLLISPTLYRRFFKKHYQRIIDYAHAAGLRVEFHCCGAVRELIPELIDTGIDILNPIQTSATGMDPQELKRLYGRQIAFSGGIDVQSVLPVRDPQGVKAEVHHLLDTMGADGGYILGPSHAIQVDTPPANIVAMYEAVQEHYA